jgi:hypothetical protein
MHGARQWRIDAAFARFTCDLAHAIVSARRGRAAIAAKAPQNEWVAVS